MRVRGIWEEMGVSERKTKIIISVTYMKNTVCGIREEMGVSERKK